MKIYDKENDRIVFYNKQANIQFWENHWNNIFGPNLHQAIADHKNNRLILDTTRKYFDDKNGWILEGGCGIEGHEYCLQHAGYTETKEWSLIIDI